MSRQADKYTWVQLVNWAENKQRHWLVHSFDTMLLDILFGLLQSNNNNIQLDSQIIYRG